MSMPNPYNYARPKAAINLDGLLKKNNPETVGSSASPGKQVNQPSVADKYLEQKVMSARPEELTLMLYDGAVRFLNQVKIFNSESSIEKSHNANSKAQLIISELRATLDMKIEMSAQLDSLYDFMLRRLFEANSSKDDKIVDEVLGLVVELRDTWKEAFKL